jgi:hypothetical protein
LKDFVGKLYVLVLFSWAEPYGFVQHPRDYWQAD